MPFTKEDLDRMNDWFSVVTRHREDVSRDYDLAAKIRTERARLEAR